MRVNGHLAGEGFTDSMDSLHWIYIGAFLLWFRKTLFYLLSIPCKNVFLVVALLLFMKYL